MTFDVAKLDEASRSLSPLPSVLSHGLIPVAMFGLLSFVCSTGLFIYLTFRLVSWRRKSAGAPVNQVLFLIYNLLFAGKHSMAIRSSLLICDADIQQGIAFLLNISALKNNALTVGTTLCFAQGWFVSTGDLASSVFICAIAVHTFFGVVKSYRLPSVYFYSSIACLWVFVYLMALLGPVIHRDDFYVRASAWVYLSETGRFLFD
jgi:hypothetical protein